jgi:hypothetical protein
MDRRCEETRAIAAELALGVADGEERGRALQHLAECAACRAEVESLAELADELLLLAPEREPPVGFESRVLGEFRPVPQRRRRRRIALALAPVAAAAAAAAITLGIVSDDVRLADHYRDTLSAANGKEFDAYALRAASGRSAGEVFAYQGSPSWLVMTVDRGQRAGWKGAELVMDDGRRVPIRWFYLSPEWGSCGGAVGVDLERVSVLRVVAKSGGEPLVARFNTRA